MFENRIFCLNEVKSLAGIIDLEIWRRWYQKKGNHQSLSAA